MKRYDIVTSLPVVERPKSAKKTAKSKKNHRPVQQADDVRGVSERIFPASGRGLATSISRQSPGTRARLILEPVSLPNSSFNAYIIAKLRIESLITPFFRAYLL